MMVALENERGRELALHWGLWRITISAAKCGLLGCSGPVPVPACSATTIFTKATFPVRWARC